jgi:dihydrofolate reductase
VARLKQEHDRIHTTGSGSLVQALLGHDLVDELNLWIYPVLLGSGKRVFAEGTIPTALRLVDSRTDSAGTVVLTYKHAGRPAFGNMAWDADGSTQPVSSRT